MTDAVVSTVVDDGDVVHAECFDGRTFSAQIIVGADGLRSTLRTMFADDEPVCSGYVAYRGAVPMEVVDRHADLRDVVAWLGPGLHLVQYPLRSGRMYNQVAVFRSAAWGRGEEDWGTFEELTETFAKCSEHVRESTRMLGTDHRWPMYDRLPIDTWTRGRVALLGDAAHPMLQYLAQGACQAIQDADVLAATLPAGGLTDGAAVHSALANYAKSRVEIATRVQHSARTWGEIWHVGGVAKLLRDEYLLDRDPGDLRHVDWLYGQPEPAAT